ncbi:hypothetical protein GY45DRAFT_1374223 [Cubamyces sp. BRFM 1775]|nr:hypothetical protein GY45DRAFT_1374223 [Cubamyces sp. BRFM 1775]
MPFAPSNNAMASTNPYGIFPHDSSLEPRLGAFLLATFIGLMLYGLTLHQSYRYFRLFSADILLLKTIVVLTVITETIHIFLCTHICYFYLVTNYFNPAVLLEGVWSFQVLPIATTIVISLSQGFFARRVYLLGARFRPIVAVIPILMLVAIGFAIATSVESFISGTFANFQRHTWLISAGFGAALLIDVLLSGALVITLHGSRTGFERTDSLIDVLIIYNINTGLLTGVFSVLSLVFAVVAPDNLIYSAFNLIATKCYANSLLAVLNSRGTLKDRIQGDCFTTGTLGRTMLARTADTQRNAIEMWNVPESQLPDSDETGVTSTVVDIKVQPGRDIPVIIRGDEDSVHSERVEPK